jgi:hypothetical protein
MLVTVDNAIQILQEKYGGSYLVKKEVVVGKLQRKVTKEIMMMVMNSFTK